MKKGRPKLLIKKTVVTMTMVPDVLRAAKMLAVTLRKSLSDTIAMIVGADERIIKNIENEERSKK